MKKSELRQIIKEELSKLNEKSSLQGRDIENESLNEENENEPNITPQESNSMSLDDMVKKLSFDNLTSIVNNFQDSFTISDEEIEEQLRWMMDVYKLK